MNCKSFGFIFLALFYCLPLKADVVKPALIEISVYTRGELVVELRASIEALMTGINSRYSNTRLAPNAKEYDYYRVMSSADLRQAFKSFEQTLIDGVDVKLDGESIPLQITSVEIPEPGYTKVPRISTIHLSAKIDRHYRQLTWYYPQKFGDHATRVRQVDSENKKWHWSDHQWIKEDVYTEPYSLGEIFTRQSFVSVLKTYVGAGFQHIVPLGMDHILFVLGIFLLSMKMKPLLWQVTMFTLAHSITLSLSMLGIFSLPSRIVEPMIALSIAFVAIENLFSPKLHKSRLWVVFGFGLLHGLGFASMLSDFGMPRDSFALALVSFNVGIEFGQLFVITLAYFGFAVWFRKQPQVYRRFAVIPLSVLISTIALYWFWERLEWVSWSQLIAS
jgi:hydrogenase/urease accessory protein HupE